MLYFPRPYPDELIGSVLARACRHTGLSLKSLMWKLLARNHGYMSILIATGLNRICRRTGLDPNVLLWSHTAFPYVVAFMPSIEVKRLAAKILEPTPSSSIAPLTQSATQGLPYRRYCATCVIADARRFGESYWHRSHQLPGVYVCTVHDTPLLETKIAVKGLMRHWSYALPEDVGGQLTVLTLPEPLARFIAARSTATLSEDWARLEDWRTHYRQMAIQRGYLRSDGHIAGKQLAHELHLYYGPQFLNQVDCALSPGAPNAWPLLMVRESVEGPFAPIKHILLETFLTIGPAASHQTPYQRPGPKPRDYAALDGIISRRLEKYLQSCSMQRQAVSARQYLIRNQLWGTVRHQLTQFPLTLAFLQSSKGGAHVAEGHLGVISADAPKSHSDAFAARTPFPRPDQRNRQGRKEGARKR